MFIIGCPRSGTTLLQSLLGAHPAVWTVPETHYFTKVIGHDRRYRRFGVIRPTVHHALRRLHSLDIPFGAPTSHGLFDIRARSWVRAFQDSMDAGAQLTGATAWAEKTPGHLHFIPEISEGVDDPQFVHVLRNGEQTVDSLFEAVTSDRELWLGHRRMLPFTRESCIRQWLIDTAISSSCIGRPGHHFVRYDQLVEDPGGVAARLLEAVGLEVDATTPAALVRGRARVASLITEPDEKWKINALGQSIVHFRPAIDPAATPVGRLALADAWENILARLEHSAVPRTVTTDDEHGTAE